jgi:8-oxo-dGTP diphosphatase
VLLVKRPANKKVNPGKYSGIGGKVEPGESYLQAAKREMKEEIGLETDNLYPYGVTQTVDAPTGAEWVHVNFLSKIPKIIEMEPSEEGEFHWVDPATVDKLEMVFDLQKYAQILAKNDRVFVLGQFVFDNQNKLIRENIQTFF